MSNIKQNTRKSSLSPLMIQDELFVMALDDPMFRARQLKRFKQYRIILWLLFFVIMFGAIFGPFYYLDNATLMSTSTLAGFIIGVVCFIQANHMDAQIKMLLLADWLENKKNTHG